MDIQIGNAAQFWWLIGIAVAACVVLSAMIAHRKRLREFATANLLDRLIPRQLSRRRLIKTVTVIVALCLLTFGLVDIRWGKDSREVPQKGIEVMFVLDVSRSMLADDVVPNRLNRAKQQIKDMVDEMAGDRVGLVVFSGEAKQQIPLTSHYRDFKRSLDEVGPYNVQLGGSNLGEAIDVATRGFLNKTNSHKAIVLLTDGEDQESRPVEVAQQAHRDHGVRVFTIGLGDMETGSRIPVGQNATGRRFLTHEGQQVWSKLNGEVLEQIALSSNGAYVPAGTMQVDMAGVYHRYIADVAQTEFETARINAYVPRYQYFVAAALALVLLESLWPMPVAGHATRPTIGGPVRSAV
ncbi:MAG: VWA domain-containing protein [Planctomycetota bacterium]